MQKGISSNINHSPPVITTMRQHNKLCSILLLLTATIALLTSCGSSNPLVGKWNYTHWLNNRSCSVGKEGTVTFKSNGSGAKHMKATFSFDSPLTVGGTVDFVYRVDYSFSYEVVDTVLTETPKKVEVEFDSVAFHPSSVNPAFEKAFVTDVRAELEGDEYSNIVGMFSKEQLYHVFSVSDQKLVLKDIVGLEYEFTR